MMWLCLLLIGCALSEQKVNNLNVGGQGMDNVQEEILAAMKDSGVLDEWKDKLDDMLFNEDDTDKKNIKKNVKKPASMINEQEREMLKTFIDEYKADSNVAVSTDLILNIVEKVQKTPKPNLPQLFVHLGPVIDVLAKIADHTKDLQKVIDRQAPLFNSPAKPKDILHTLAENLKSELVRLRPKEQQKRKQQGGDSGLGLMDYISLGSSLLKGGNGADMLSLLSGDVDIASMLKMLPQLLEGDEYKTLVPKMIKSYLSSSTMGALALGYIENNVDAAQAEKGLEVLVDSIKEFTKTKSFDRLVSIINMVMQAKNTEEIAKVRLAFH